MSKRPVAYIKPQDPSFLAKLKREAGYKEGPTVDTKREVRDLESGSDDENDLKPVVVVLGEGDLTAEEADKVAKEKEEAETSAKADLSKRVVFQKPKRSTDDSTETEGKKKRRKRDGKQTKQLLSFDEHDDDDDDDV